MARLVLDPDMSAVPRARHWAADGCAAHHLGAPAQAVVELLVSEAVANAVEHGAGPVRLDLDRDPGTGHLRLAVHDEGRQLPVLRHVGSAATAGRGIALIDRFAAAWGSIPDAPGKTVWFDVDPGAGLRAAA
ncbi:ATP-binding protein [Kineococcus sp. T13]|uniref:ATP-binding protein n=1 Tax=Kineococcus vitellinus TaxID=2696565 RepID=UPI0030B837C7|nr:ATP-binding protein [Kineococcus vitellinus]